MAKPQDYKLQPPGSTLKSRNQGQAVLARWFGYGVIVLAIIAWLTGGGILQRMFIKPVQNAIFHIKPTPNPATQTFVTGAAPTASPADNMILASDVASTFKNGVNPQPVISNHAAVAAGLATPSPEQIAQRQAEAAAALRDAAANLNGTDTGTIGTGTGYTAMGTPNFGSMSDAPTPTPAPSAAPSTQVAAASSGGVMSYPILQTPQPDASPTPASREQHVPYPQSSASIYDQPLGGTTYVGLEPGQQNGVYPQSTDTMTVAQRAQFLDSGAPDIYSDEQVQAPRFTSVIYPVDPIHARLSVTILSSLPGMVYAIIINDVRCHVPGDPDTHPICIPAGTQLYGPYNADVHPGDSRVQVHWEAMIWPNVGYTLALKDVQGSDDEGANGLPANVDNHVGRVYTSTFIQTILAGVANMASGGLLASGRGLFYQGAGQSLINNANANFQAKAQQAPTLGVPNGTSFTLHFAQIQPIPPYMQLVREMRERRRSAQAMQ